MKPRDNVIHVQFGQLSRQRNQKLARAYYERANGIDEDPSQLDEAKRLYELAIKLDPDFALAHCNLGTALVRLHDASLMDPSLTQLEPLLMQARLCFERAIVLSPRMPEAHYNLGHVLLNDGKMTQGRQCFAMAVFLDPTFADAWYNLAVEYTRIGQVALARNGWKRYLELEPKGMWAQSARKNLLMVGAP